MSLLPSLEIRVVSNKSDWKAFIKLPFEFYSSDPCWVPPLLMEERNALNSKKNPFFEHGRIKAWLAFDKTQVVGRILAFSDDNYNDFHNSKVGFFGYFESIDSQHTSNALIDHASAWLRDQGMESIRGPVNLSVTNECGFLVSGFNSSPFIKMGHSFPYYPSLVKNYGFELEHRLLAYLITNETVSSSELWRRLEKINERALKNHEVQIRSINMSRYKEEVGHVFRIYNEFMKDNWGFVPATKAEMYFMADILKFIIDPKMVLMAEYRGEIVGCSLGVPNINQLLPELKGKLFPFGFIKLFRKRKKISNFRLMLIGILPEFRERGFDVLLYYETIRRSLDRGYESAELSWISEENKNLRSILEKLGATLHKTYHIYEKNLIPG